MKELNDLKEMVKSLQQQISLLQQVDFNQQNYTVSLFKNIKEFVDISGKTFYLELNSFFLRVTANTL